MGIIEPRCYRCFGALKSSPIESIMSFVLDTEVDTCEKRDLGIIAVSNPVQRMARLELFQG